MAEGLVTLRAVFPFWDDVTFGTEHYRHDADGTVNVPRAAVQALLHNGGYVMVERAPAAGPGMVRLCHPEGIGCGVGGYFYEPDAAGVVTVPNGAVAELRAHGFRGVDEPLGEAADPRDREIARLQGEYEALAARYAELQAAHDALLAKRAELEGELEQLTAPDGDGAKVKAKPKPGSPEQA